MIQLSVAYKKHTLKNQILSLLEITILEINLLLGKGEVQEETHL